MGGIGRNNHNSFEHPFQHLTHWSQKFEDHEKSWLKRCSYMLSLRFISSQYFGTTYGA
jgi:hypothetical protein